MNTQVMAKQKKQEVIAKTENPLVPARIVRSVPRVDILEDADQLLLIAELPGVSADSLEIKFANDTLTLRGTRQPDITGKPVLGQLVVMEYSRSFVLPQGIDATKISAKLVNGLLEVHLPKAASYKPRVIAVKTA